MPLNETDRAWIRQEIQAAHRRQGWGKLTGFIKDWSGARAAVAILIFAFTKWEAYVEFRTTTNSRLSNIEKSLGEIQGNLAKQSLLNHALLPLADFKATLPDLNSSIAVARQQKIKVPRKVVDDLAEKLSATDVGTSGFWPAAAEVISYRSFNSGSWTMPANLPTCTDSLPTPSTVTISSPTKLNINPGVYENCRFTLDSPQEGARLNEIILTKLVSIIFKHCLIVYRGGPINLVLSFEKHNVAWSHVTPDEGRVGGTMDVSVRNAVQFQDSLFDIVLHSAPSQPGQDLTRFLLANTGTTIILPISTQS